MNPRDSSWSPNWPAWMKLTGCSMNTFSTSLHANLRPSIWITVLVTFVWLGSSAQNRIMEVGPDSLTKFLLHHGPDSFLQVFPVRQSENLLKNDPQFEGHKKLLLQLVSLEGLGQQEEADALRQLLLSRTYDQRGHRKLLEFLFAKGHRFFVHREVYLSFQRNGADLAAHFNEPRAEFSFLQQLFTYYQITKQIDKASDLLDHMKRISQGQPYLKMQIDLHQAYIHKVHLNDSCIFYYDRFLTRFTPKLGQPDPYFLIDESFELSRDSGVVAGAYQEYALYLMSKGDLVQAGRLLINAAEVIPHSSKFDLLRIQNHLNLSSIYHDLSNPGLAIQHAQNAIDLSELAGLKQLRDGRVAFAMGKALMLGGEHSVAETELQQSYTYARNGLTPQDPKKRALYLAINAMQQRDMEAANHWLDSAAAVQCESDRELAFLIPYSSSLRDHLTGAQVNALANYQTVRSLALTSQIAPWIVQAHELGYQIYKSKGELQNSLAEYEAFVQYRDSVYRSGQEVALFETETKYQQAVQQEQIAKLEVRDQINTAKIAGQRRIFFAGGLIILLLTAFLVTYLILNRRLREQHRIITQAIQEKNILLKEIHHRVKNNLQVISSLLKLQSGYIQDHAALQAIAEGRSRVQSMALLHQNLYQEENLTGVNMKEYFDNLIEGLFDTYNISTDRIQLVKNVEPISLDIDTVIPLGLITNELISNALKHAFSNDRPGKLYVNLYEQQGKLHLEVKDDGVGYAPTQSTGFGTNSFSPSRPASKHKSILYRRMGRRCGW